MDQPTQKLLALLGSDSCSAICERLEAGPATKTELAEELGLQTRDVASTLDALLLIGLVGWSKSGAAKRGRRPEIWELVAADELAELEAWVKAMRHRLIDRSGGR